MSGGPRFAADGGHAALAALLLDRGADAAAKMNDGQTPLHFAEKNNHEEVAALLRTRQASAETSA